MQIADEEILAAFSEDVNKGGKLLFQRYYKPLVVFSSSLLDDCAYLEDMVQDVFYHFIRGKIYQRVSPKALGTFLFRSVKNACMNKMRDSREYSRAELLTLEAAEEEAMTVSPELMQAIHAAIEALPEKTRAVIHAVVIEGKKYREAADQLGVSINTVKTLLSHGLKQLRQQFPDPLIFFFILT